MEQAPLSYHEAMAARAAAAAEPVDRYHQGAGRDCPSCANRPVLELQQVTVSQPDLMPNIDEVGTLDMWEELGG